MIPKRGEGWLFDLGLAAKTRPVLIVSGPYGDTDRALVTLIPHTTSVRNGLFEITIQTSFLRVGAFYVQGIASYPAARAIRKLGILTNQQMDGVMTCVQAWLGMT